MDRQWLFDRKWTRDFTQARQKTVRALLNDLKMKIQTSLHSALDVGCGVGDFSIFLSGLGLLVTGVDGRVENVTEAKRRHPDTNFVAADAEELASANLGSFDLVLCFGLLYHLENPFRAIRQLYCATNKVLLIEGMCLPDQKPTMGLYDELEGQDQGLNQIAFYPSEACLIKMLYHAGFSFVYTLTKLPEDDLYVESIWRKRVRTMLVASKQELNIPALTLSNKKIFRPPDTSSIWSPAEWNPWATRTNTIMSPFRTALLRARAFASRVLRITLRTFGRNKF